MRQWLISRGFMGKPGQQVPEMTEAYCEEVSSRYIELYERITGKKFEPGRTDVPLQERISANVAGCLAGLAGC